ncbi:MAG: hypothetical protein M3014_13955, partial [Chloroflexota bacterium]|nr:hypothetical protein [Chloroflexota bacterium]
MRLFPRIRTSHNRRLLLAGALALGVPAVSLAAPLLQTPTAQPKIAASTPVAIAGGKGVQSSPSIAGNTLVYADCGTGKCAVMGEDVTARQPYTISVDSSNAYDPSTDGVHVVWVDARNAPGA